MNTKELIYHKYKFGSSFRVEFVISLVASDEYLRNRVMNLPEAVVTGTHNTEEGLQRRLSEYRTLNTDDETVLNYFDELEIHPEHIGLLLIDVILYFLYVDCRSKKKESRDSLFQPVKYSGRLEFANESLFSFREFY